MIIYEIVLATLIGTIIGQIVYYSIMKIPIFKKPIVKYGLPILAALLLIPLYCN